MSNLCSFSKLATMPVWSTNYLMFPCNSSCNFCALWVNFQVMLKRKLVYFFTDRACCSEKYTQSANAHYLFLFFWQFVPILHNKKRVYPPHSSTVHFFLSPFCFVLFCRRNWISPDVLMDGYMRASLLELSWRQSVSNAVFLQAKIESVVSVFHHVFSVLIVPLTSLWYWGLVIHKHLSVVLYGVCQCVWK